LSTEKLNDIEQMLKYLDEQDKQYYEGIMNSQANRRARLMNIEVPDTAAEHIPEPTSSNASLQKMIVTVDYVTPKRTSPRNNLRQKALCTMQTNSDLVKRSGPRTRPQMSKNVSTKMQLSLPEATKRNAKKRMARNNIKHSFENCELAANMYTGNPTNDRPSTRKRKAGDTSSFSDNHKFMRI